MAEEVAVMVEVAVVVLAVAVVVLAAALPSPSLRVSWRCRSTRSSRRAVD